MQGFIIAKVEKQSRSINVVQQIAVIYEYKLPCLISVNLLKIENTKLLRHLLRRKCTRRSKNDAHSTILWGLQFV